MSFKVLISFSFAPLLLSICPQDAKCSQVKRSVKIAHPAPKKMTDGEEIARAISVNMYPSMQSAAHICDGLQFRALSTTLNSFREVLSREKGEFETSAEYEQRSNNLNHALNDGGPLFACFNLNDDRNLEFHYNADKREFSLSLRLLATVDYVEKELGVQKGQSNSGVKFSWDLIYSLSSKLDISLPENSDGAECILPKNYEQGYISKLGGVFPYNQDSAKNLKSYGKLIVEYTLTKPYVDFNSSRHVASLTERYQSKDDTITVYGQLVGAVAVDRTGAVAWKCGINS